MAGETGSAGDTRTNTSSDGSDNPSSAFEGGPEMASGKGAKDENFPVGSFLLPAHLRPHVARFYDFARAADDIVDNATLEAAEKIDRLDAFEAALTGAPGYGDGFEKPLALRRTLQETGVSDRHARDLLAAFRQDAVKLRYANWQELLDYCVLSANSVGRFMLDLHGEPVGSHRHSDALCTILQVINHLQDCGDDYRDYHRVYIPEDWMAQEGVSVADLDAPALNAGLRRVIDRMLSEVDTLLSIADGLPASLTGRRMAMECAVIVGLAIGSRTVSSGAIRWQHGWPSPRPISCSPESGGLPLAFSPRGERSKAHDHS